MIRHSLQRCSLLLVSVRASGNWSHALHSTSSANESRTNESRMRTLCVCLITGKLWHCMCFWCCHKIVRNVLQTCSKLCGHVFYWQTPVAAAALFIMIELLAKRFQHWLNSCNTKIEEAKAIEKQRMMKQSKNNGHLLLHQIHPTLGQFCPCCHQKCQS